MQAWGVAITVRDVPTELAGLLTADQASQALVP